MMSHTNSYRRKDLESPGLPQRLGIRRVPDKDIVLKPALLQ